MFDAAGEPRRANVALALLLSATSFASSALEFSISRSKGMIESCFRSVTPFL
jgi:hypothetical protein